MPQQTSSAETRRRQAGSRFKKERCHKASNPPVMIQFIRS